MKKLLGIVLLVPLFAWAQTAFDGTWKVNLSTAQLSQKPNTFALEKGEYTCSTCVPKIAVKADGTDQKVPGAKEYDTLAVKQLNDKAVQFTRKKDGKVVSEGTETVSPDGKTLTGNFQVFPPEGKPVTFKETTIRVAPVPAGAHAISGSWRAGEVQSVSENGLLVTFKSTPNGLTMKTPTGESYEAKFDGKDVPLKGDRAGGTISLKKVNDNTIEETYKQDGKAVNVNDLTVQGKTMKIVTKDLRRGTTDSFTAEKQ